MLPATDCRRPDRARARRGQLEPANFQKQSTPPTLLSPSTAPGLPRPADLPLDADARRPPLPVPGLGRPDIRQSARRRRHRRDLVLEQHDLPGEHRPLLAGPRRRREPERPRRGRRPERSRRSSRRQRPARRTRRRATRCRSGRGAPVQGASSYDLAVDQPDGQHHDYSDIRTPAASFIKMTGTGVWHWRVRAEFPEASTGTTPGPVLGDAVVHAHDRRAGNAKTDSARGPRPAQLGSTARGEGVQGPDRLEPGLQPRRRDRHDRQPELRADDDPVRLHDVETSSTGTSPASTRTATRATGRRRSRSSCCRGSASRSAAWSATSTRAPCA